MILVLDGANLLHRARSGFQLGPHNVAFNFFRQLRALVERFEPTRVYMALEGMPKRQLALLPEYKANRAIDASTEAGERKLRSLEDFRRQKDGIVALLRRRFPISVVRHPDFEGDDTLYNVIRSSSTMAEFVVVSTDSDFTQLLQEFPNVRLYDPVRKAYVEAPPHDYVTWKALKGDASDNVPALVTEGTATELLADPDALKAFLAGEAREPFLRNHELIRFRRWAPDEALGMESSSPERDWGDVKAAFDDMLFRSITKEGAWERFCDTFEPLWG